MSRKKNISSGVYRYLEDTGVLASGSEDQIAAARKEYWRNYKRAWRKERNAILKEFKIHYTAEENAIIGKDAKRFHISKTKYIREAALAHARQHHIVANAAEITNIRQLLTLTVGYLQELTDAVPADIGVTLMRKMEALETVIHDRLMHPQTKDT